jgi:hypothetical protein
MQIFDCIAGKKNLTPFKIGIKDKKSLMHLLMFYKMLLLVIRIIIRILICSSAGAYGALVIHEIIYKSESYLETACWLAWSPVSIYMVYLLYGIYSIAFFCMIITCYFCLLKINNVNNQIQNILSNFDRKKSIFFKRIINQLKIRRFLEDHNHVCGNISNYNTFWSKALGTFIVSIVIIDLLLKNQILFSTINIPTRIMYISISIGITSYLGFLLFFLAYSSESNLKMYKMMINLVWNSNGTSMAAKMKVSQQL